MTVPITSDLEGYEKFWSTWAVRGLFAAAFGWGVIVGELGAILWALWRTP